MGYQTFEYISRPWVRTLFVDGMNILGDVLRSEVLHDELYLDFGQEVPSSWVEDVGLALFISRSHFRWLSLLRLIMTVYVGQLQLPHSPHFKELRCTDQLYLNNNFARNCLSAFSGAQNVLSSKAHDHTVMNNINSSAGELCPS